MMIGRFKKKNRTGYLLPNSIIFCLFLISIIGCGGGNGSDNPQPQEPSITTVAPPASATEIETNTVVQATFNSDINPTTINTSTFTLTSPSGINVNGNVSYDPNTKTAIFTPTITLAPLTPYTATISGIIDVAGRNMSSPYSWSFVTVTGFWAFDFDLNSSYFLLATKAGEGTFCTVYLEQGQSVDQDTINEIINQFDNAIYPNEVSTFGEEPNPGIDGITKIFILLLDVRDGYAPGSTGYIAGYFNPFDEYDISTSSNSNQKELFSMDVNPGIPGDNIFMRTLAHEFQHLINWNQKTNLRGVFEETWLDEAMSEIAPVFCSYGPDYERVISYQYQPWDSLVDWWSTTSDYSTVYMWAQYMKDRVTNTDSTGHSVFWNINHTSDVGINAVNTSLSAVGYSKDFSDVFRDWSIANYLGLNTVPGHPEWSYSSIHTEAGYITEYGPLSGLPVNDSIHINASSVGGLHLWGLDYFEFTKTGTGTVTWSITDPTDEAAFIDLNSNTVTFSMESGTAYPYTNSGILIARNPTDLEKWSSTGGGTMTFTSIRSGKNTTKSYSTKGFLPYPDITLSSTDALTPKTILLQVSSDTVAKALSLRTGRPIPICVDHFFRDKERHLRKKMLNLENAIN